jgi:xylulokinase
VLDSIGTAEGLLVCLDQPVDDVTMGGQGFTQGAHVVPDQYYGLGAIYTAGASYEWARQAVGGGRSHSELLAGARSVPAGSLGVMFLPHLRLAMFPELDSRARGAFVGLTTDVTSDAMIRAVLEGVAMEGRAGFGPLARYAQLPTLSDIKVIGGTSRNQLLIEIKASVMNARHHVLEIPEASALGAAMLAGMAAGVYRSADDAIAAVRSDARVIEPDSDVVALYDTLFEDIYRHLYAALRPMHHRLFDLFMSSNEGGAE